MISGCFPEAHHVIAHSPSSSVLCLPPCNHPSICLLVNHSTQISTDDTNVLRLLSFNARTHTLCTLAPGIFVTHSVTNCPTAAPLYLIDAEHLTEMSKFKKKKEMKLWQWGFSLFKFTLNLRHRRSYRWSCNIANTGDTLPIFHVPTWQVAATTYTCQPQRRPEYFLASSKLSVAKATAYFFVVVVLLATSAFFSIFIVAMLWNFAFTAIYRKNGSISAADTHSFHFFFFFLLYINIEIRLLIGYWLDLCNIWSHLFIYFSW